MKESRFQVIFEEETGTYSLTDTETKTKEGYRYAIPEWANFRSENKQKVQDYADKLNSGEARLPDEETREKLRGSLDTDLLFVYGIFIDPRRQELFGMEVVSEYATVPGFATVGSNIVVAIPAP